MGVSRVVNRLKATLQPKPGLLRIVLDVLLVLVCGTWFFGGVAALLFFRPDPDAYACGGPGFADFGCTGGIEAVVGNIIGVIFMACLLGIFLVAFTRLKVRLRDRLHG